MCLLAKAHLNFFSSFFKEVIFLKDEKQLIQKTAINPTAIVNPVPPVLVSCKNGDKINMLTIAWTGIICTKPSMTYISVRPERYSYDIIKESGEFVINLATRDIVKSLDFCGVRSGRDIDKLKETGLTAFDSREVSAPGILECPVNIECRVKEIIPLGSHHMFLAEVVGVSVSNKLIDKDGKIQLEKANLLAYAHGEYYELGKILGTFGFSVMKKKTAQRRARASNYKKKQKGTSKKAK